MPDTYSPTRAIIYLGALKKNLVRARKASPGKIVAVVKANAYGHGMVPVVAALADADAFAVATLDEALRLRAAYPHIDIIIFQGFYHRSEAEVIIQHHFIPVIHTPELLRWILEHPRRARLRVVLEHNSGMNRAGLSTQQLKSAIDKIEAADNLEILFIMTHFRSANKESPQHNEMQLAIFKKAMDGMHYKTSLCNSAALLGFPAAHSDYERPGLMLYGASPLDDRTAEKLGLTPAMHIRSQLIAVHNLKTGDEVGYEGVWRAPSDCKIGLIPIGYGDGYPRTSTGLSLPVLVKGRRSSLIGRVSMDLLSVDLNGCPDAQVGDEVTLWGKGLPVDEVARGAGQIVNNLLTGVTTRVPRLYH